MEKLATFMTQFAHCQMFTPLVNSLSLCNMQLSTFLQTQLAETQHSPVLSALIGRIHQSLGFLHVLQNV